MSIFDANPPVTALSARPFTVSDLDAMPNADRIWATIRVVKEALRERIAEIEERNAHFEYDESDLEAAEDRAREDCIEDVQRILRGSMSNAEKIRELEDLK